VAFHDLVGNYETQPAQSHTQDEHSEVENPNVRSKHSKQGKVENVSAGRSELEEIQIWSLAM
jgi:hypothetical protein